MFRNCANRLYPSIKIQPEQKEQEVMTEPEQIEEKIICSICLEDIEINGKVTLSCCHEFHLKCYMELLVNGGVNRSNCPNCRAAQDLPNIGSRGPRDNQTPIDYLIEIARGMGIGINQGPQPQLAQPQLPPLINQRPPRPPRRPVPFHRHNQLRRRIIREIRQNAKTVQQISTALILSDARVRTEMNKMVREGLLSKWREGRGYMYIRNE